jgi:amino acid adenylation domain-containing protein
MTQLTRYGRMMAAGLIPGAPGTAPSVVASTPAQREIWALSVADPHVALAMVEALELRIDGPLDVAALQLALHDLVARHDALRAQFREAGRIIEFAHEATLDLRIVDREGDSQQEHDAHDDRLREELLQRAFDLSEPLIRARLLRCGHQHHRLLVAVHRLVCDRRSLSVLVEDLAALYAARAERLAPQLPGAESFAEFARTVAAEADASEQAQEPPRAAPAQLELPSDYPRSRQRDLAARRRQHGLSTRQFRALASGAERLGVSLATLASAACAALLARLTGETRIGFELLQTAMPTAAALPVGRCSHALQLWVDVDPESAFESLLRQVEGAPATAASGEHATPVRKPATVSFEVCGTDQGSDAMFPGLEVSWSPLPGQFEPQELAFALVIGSDGTRLECQYQASLYADETIGHWLEAFACLLDGVAQAPGCSIAELPLLGARGRDAIEAWQPAFQHAPGNGWIHQWIDATCGQRGDGTAVLAGDGTLTYAELRARANRIAHALAARGIGPGTRVGICLERGLDMVPAMLAVLKRGAAYVPLDPGFPADRLEFMIDDAGLALVISSQTLVDVLSLPDTERLLLDVQRDELLALPGHDPEPAEGQDPHQAPAYVIYTSGSTGKPKGVVVPHAAVSNFLHAMALQPGLAPGDRIAAVTTLSFDIAVLELLLPLWVGAELVIASRDEAADGRELRRLLESSAATVLQATPAAWRLLLDAGFHPPEGFRGFCGGEALPADLAGRLGSECAELWNLYGPTETTVWSTAWRVQRRARGISIGQPIRNTRIYILDARGQQCPVGVAGEICIGGDGVALGYLDRPELTDDRFRPDPFAAAAEGSGTPRLYRTGDRGRWCSDGHIEHLGRLDYQIKLRGYRIELGEIEARITELDGIARCLVIVREDRPGDQRLVAYVVPVRGVEFDATATRATLRRFLPEYMVPQHFVALAELPRLPNGKTDRAALPAPIAGDRAPASGTVSRAPGDATEVMVAAAMASVLGRQVTRVDEDFFELGGHSLLAAQLVARLNRQFAATLTLRALYDAPSVAALSAMLREARRTANRERVDPIPADGSRRLAPLSPDQSRVWLLQSIQPDAVAYNTPSAHRLRGPLDEAAFERAFVRLLRRQPSLRTSIERDVDGQLLQLINDVDTLLEPEGRLPPLFPAEDLRSLPEIEREAALLCRMQALIDTPFDLTAAPLFRIRMYRLDAQEYAMLFVPHDIIWDGWSFDLLVEELSALYAAELQGVEADLPQLPIGYGDYAAWHARWLQGPAYAEQLRFWRERLASTPPLPPLPADRPRQSGMSGRGGSDWVRVPRWLTEALHEVARDTRTTLFAVLLGAYAILLARMSGRRDVVIGTPLRGRSHEQIEPLMGQFTKLLPLALSVDPDLGFTALVRNVRDVVLECFGHPDIQLEDLLAAAPSEHGSSRPLYQALLSFQDTRHWPHRWGNVVHEQIPVVQQGATEDFGLWLVEHADGLAGAVMFNAEHFDRDSATLFRDQFLSLIARIAERPTETVRALAAPSPFELDRLSGWSNGRTAPDVGGDSLTARFRRVCAVSPQAAAVIEGGRSQSYRVLARGVAMAAAQLRTCTQVGDVVVIALPHGVHRFAAILGCLSLGAVCMLLDPQRPVAHLAACIGALPKRRGVGRFLVAEAETAHALRWPARQHIEPRRLRQPCDARQEQLRTPACSRLLLPLEQDGGGIELVTIAERSLLALDSGLREHRLFTAESAVAALAPPDAPRSLIEGLLPLMAGAAVVVDPDRRTLANWLDCDTIDTLMADAEAWRREFEAGWIGRDGLTTVAVGAPVAVPGEPALPVLRSRHFRAFGDARAGVWTLFGPKGDVARVLPARTVRIVDADHAACALNVFGELWLGVDTFDGEAATEVAVGMARWRADGSVELRAGAGSLEGAELASLLPGSVGARAPRTPLQALFHDLWSEVLGHNEFGIDDNFFDLGGYSLIAVRMFHLAEQHTGVNLPLATLYRAPTIESLAAAFAAAGSRVSDSSVQPGVLPPAADNWRPLVPIRPAGRQRPLFLVHAVGGNVMNYRVLARGLPAEVPVFGLQAVGLDGITPPLTTVTAMAERYLQEIVGQQPRGPYRIGGGSMGGVIAYEIARLLRERGEDVQLLAMFDSEMPQWRDSDGRRKGWSDLMQWLHAARAAGGLPRKLAASVASRGRRVADRLSVRLHRALGRPLPHSVRYRHLQDVSLRANREFQPQPIDCDITLFLASDGRSGRDFDPTLGWSEVVGERVRVVAVGGTHEDLISRASLAAALASTLHACAAGEAESNQPSQPEEP